MTGIEELWARVPDVHCKGLCQAYCGPVLMSETERLGILHRHGLALGRGETKTGTRDCPALTADGRCAVYADRPLVCRLWGAVQSLPCPHGCQPALGRVPDENARELFAAAAELDSRASEGV